MKIAELGARLRSSPGMVATYAAQVAIVLCGFLYVIVATRYGGVAVYGEYAILVSLSGVVSNLLTFRTNEAVISFYGRAKLEERLDVMKFALVAGVVLDVTMALLIFFLIFFLAGVFSADFLKSSSAAFDVRLFALVTVLSFLRGTPIALLQAELKFIRAAILSASEQITRVAALVCMAVAFPKLSLRHLVISAVIAGTLVSLVAWYDFVKRWRGEFSSVRYSRDRALHKDYASFSVSTFVSSTLKAGNQQMDTLILGVATGPVVVGTYSLLRQFLSPVGFISMPLSTLSYPGFVADVASGRKSNVILKISETNRKLLAIYGVLSPILLSGFFFYSLMLGLGLGKAEIFAMLLVALQSCLNAMQWWVRPFANATSPRRSIYANAFATAFILLFLYPIAKVWGLLGVSAVMSSLSILLTLYWRKVVCSER